MKLGLLVSLFLLLACDAYGEAKPSTGDFLAKCRAIADQAGSNDQAANNYCLGYAKGFMDGVLLDEVLTYRELKQRLCIPGSVTPREMLKAVMKYIREHPEKNDQPIAVTTWEAVDSSYRCRK